MKSLSVEDKCKAEAIASLFQGVEPLASKTELEQSKYNELLIKALSDNVYFGSFDDVYKALRDVIQVSRSYIDALNTELEFTRDMFCKAVDLDSYAETVAKFSSLVSDNK